MYAFNWLLKYDANTIPSVSFLGLYNMHKKTDIKRFFFFFKKKGEGGWFFRVMTSLAFSSIGIDYPLLFLSSLKVLLHTREMMRAMLLLLLMTMN